MKCAAATRRQSPVVAAIAVALYAWWVAGLAPFTLTSALAVLMPGGLVLVWASRRRRRDWRPVEPLARSGVVAWAVLVGAVLAVELIAYRSSPREAYPTLSSMADAVLQPRPVAALAFLAWLALGWELARR